MDFLFAKPLKSLEKEGKTHQTKKKTSEIEKNEKQQTNRRKSKERKGQGMAGIFGEFLPPQKIRS